MAANREADRKMLMELSKEKLVELFLMHTRTLWTVDGLYFLGIESKFGTEAATSIDKNVWEVMGKIEARRMKNTFNLTGTDILSVIESLKLTTWALDLEHKEIEIKGNKALLRNTKCRVQNTRIEKGLCEFPCKEVRWGFLKSFAKELNPAIEVRCIVCPPDKHPENVWCEWEFTLSDKK